MSYELRGLRSTQSHGPWQLSLQFYRSPRYQPHNSSSQDQANHWQDLMSSRTQRAFASTQGCSGGCCHAASPAAVKHMPGTHWEAAAVCAAQ